MAERYRGKFSPDGGSPTTGHGPADIPPLGRPRVDPVGLRANLLMIPPVVLAFTSFSNGPAALALGLGGAATLALAAWLLREGLRAEAAFDERKIARRPALPRKILASVLTGIGIALAALTGNAGVLGAVTYGILAGVLHSVAFGIDPLRNKLVEGIDEFQQDRVARVVDEAEAYLSTMRDQIGTIGNRPLNNRVAAFTAAARKMIRTVEEDPRDLTGARKYLVVYLMGARDASIKFADHYRRKPDETARASYEALLDDLETNFAAKTDKMLSDKSTDMDIEIKVLRDRLQREGIKPEQ